MSGPYAAADRRLYSQLHLVNVNAPGATGKKSKRGLSSAIDFMRPLEPIPASPHTPPSSPPSGELMENDVYLPIERRALVDSPNEKPQTPPYREPQLLPSAIGSPQSLQGSFRWRYDGTESPASEYSDRSIDSSRNSSSFTTTPPRLPNLPKTTCAVCRDPNMILFNGTELVCGHFAHRVCLKSSIDALEGVHPSCVVCGQDCYAKRPPHTFAGRPTSVKITEACKLEQLGEQLIEREGHTKGPETSPLQLRMFVHSQADLGHEVLVKVSTPASAFEHWRYRPTQEDMDAARKLTSAALGVTSMSRSRINAESAGRLRLVSIVRDCHTQAKVTAYLFERAVVLTQMSADGFEELVHSIDLNRDDVEVRGTAGTLELAVGRASLIYKASRETIANWIAASRDLKLDFPIAQPTALSGPYYIERCLLHLVICLPFEHITSIPFVLGELGPLDRLGLVVTTPGGLCAWLAPHKTSWRGWEVIAREQYRCFDLFTPATQSILETADALLGPQVTGIQKSVVLVSGCPVATTVIGRPIHVVGIGDYDLDFLSCTAVRSGGQFYHSGNTNELRAILAGIAAAERAYTHHDVRLSLIASPGVQITEIVGLDKRAMKATGNTLEVSIGSLLAGQSRTILVVLNGQPTDARFPVLSDCQVRATSAITGVQQWETDSTLSSQSSEFQVFSERMARIAADILTEGVSLVDMGQTEELSSMLSRAIAAVKRAVAGFRSNYKLHQQPLNELTDPSLTGALAAARANILAQGLEELQGQLVHDVRSKSNVKAILLQASLVLQNQRAVTSRTLLEQVFQERLETNRF